MARIQYRRDSSTPLGTGASTLPNASIDVSRNAFIQQIVLDLKAQIKTGVTPLTSPTRWFTNQSLTFNGSSTYFSLRSLYLFHVNKRDYHTAPVMDTVTPAGLNQVVRGQWVMDTRVRPDVPSDFTALIPAFRANTLKLGLQWESAATILDAAGNFDFTNMDVHLAEVVPDTAEESAKLLSSVWAINVTEQTNPFTGTTTNFTNVASIPTGALLKDAHLFFQSPAGVANINDTFLNTSGTSADSEFRVELTKPSLQILYDSTGFDAVDKDKTELELEVRDAGVVRYDPWSASGGLPLENLDEGSVRFAFNNTTNTGEVDVVYRRYVRK